MKHNYTYLRFTKIFVLLFLLVLGAEGIAQTFNEVENNDNIGAALAGSQSRIYSIANYAGTVTSTNSDFWVLSRSADRADDRYLYLDRTFVDSNPNFDFNLWEYRGGNWGVTPINLGSLRSIMQLSGIYNYQVRLPYSTNINGSGVSNNYYALEIVTAAATYDYNFYINGSSVNGYYYCYQFGIPTATPLQVNDVDLTLNNLPSGSFDDIRYVVKFSITNSFTDFTDGYEDSQPLPTAAASNSYSGSGEHIVYVGNDGGAIQSAMTMTNLQRNTTYYYKVYTYNNCDGYIDYNNTGTPVAITTCPGTVPNSGSVNSVTATSPTSATINTLGRPVGVDTSMGYLVKFSDTNSFTAPASGTTLPAIDTDYSSKTGEQIVYTGAVGSGGGTTDDINQVITGLQINTDYYVKVYTYDLCGGTYNFETTGSAVVTTNYVCTAPSAATNLMASAAGTDRLTLSSFTQPTNSSQGTLGYIIKVSEANTFTAPTVVPSSPSTVYNSVTGGEQVVYVGSSTTPNIAITGLTENGTYFIKVYSYNTCAGSEYFETSGSTSVSVTTCGAPVGNSQLGAFREDLTWENRLSPIITNVPASAEGQVVKINIENTFTDITGILNTLPTADVNYSGSGDQVILAGVFPEGQAFTGYNLLPNTEYFFKIYSYTECNGQYYFSDTTSASTSKFTAGVTDNLASNAIINNYTGTSFTLASFSGATVASNGQGLPKGYIVKMNTTNSFTSYGFRSPLPSSNANYGGGEQVVYVGTSVTPNLEITGLTPDETYYFTIYAYADSGVPYFLNSFQQMGYEFSIVNNGSLIAPTITFDDIEVNAGGSNFNLNATSDSAGVITYRVIDDGGTGTTLSGTNNETVTIGSAGTVIVEASQQATATYQSATKTMMLTVNAELATLEGGIFYQVNSGVTTVDMTENITSNSTGAYTFEIIGETLGCSINGNLLNVNNIAGSIVVKVTQAADSNYAETVAYYSTLFYNLGFSPKTDIAHNLFDFSLNIGETKTLITGINFSGVTTTYSIVDNGGTNSTLNGNVFTAGGAGIVTLRAFLPNNSLYNETTKDVTVTINGTPQTITFDALDDVTYGDAAFDLSATASSGLSVTYVSSDATIASISGNTVTTHKEGTINITASQAGGGAYNPAPDVVQSLTVNPITINNQNVTLDTSGSVLCNTIAKISLDNTQLLVNYYLRNNNDNSIIEGPIAGTGSGISFTSETLTNDRTYNVIAVQNNQTLPSATNTLQMSNTPTATVQTLDAKTINITQPTGQSAVVSVVSSQTGVNYYLRDNVTNELLQGPLVGTGVDLSFVSEALTADRTYKVVGTDANVSNGVRTALKFDNVDDYVSIPAINSHLTNTGQATIETWVRIPASDATDVNASIITFESYPGNGIASLAVPFYINISGGTIFAGHYDDDFDDGGAYNTPGYTYPVDTWFHVAATMNGSTINFYVNGNLIGTTNTYFGYETFVLTSNIRLGRNYESTVNSGKLFGGEIAQTRIWNGIRTQSEITTSMNTQFTTPQTGLVLNYTYDQESGTTVNDLSGNSITGTLQNGVGDATNWVNDFFTNSPCGFAPMSNTVTATYTPLQEQTITFGSLEDVTFGDSDFNLTATSDSGLAITYTSSDTNVATISGNTVTIVAAGTTTITASQAGDTTYQAAIDVTQDLTVNKAEQTISFDALVDMTYGDADFDLTAIGGASGNAVTFASSDTDIVTISGSTVTIIGAGTVNITASQAGNANYNAATDVLQSLTINKAAQSISFDALSDVTVGDADFDLTATGGTSGNAVTFASSDTDIVTISGSTVTIIGAGTVNITASQEGNANYNAAADVVQSLTVDPEEVAVSIKAYIQGAAINPNIGEETLMRDDLRSAGVLPLTSPYSDTRTINNSVLVNTGSDAIVDWVWVELRDDTDHTRLIEGKSGLLQRDGDVVDIDGITPISFEQSTGMYYLAIIHRNHLAMLTINPVSLNGSSTTTINLTTDTSLIFGGANAMIDLGNGIYAMPSGDFDDNGQIQNTDVNAIINLLGGSGYSKGDLDMNGQIQNTDINNILTPNIGKGEQF